MKSLRHYFITGLAAVLPVSVTAFLFYIIVRELGSLFRPLLRRSVILAPLPEWVATLMGFVFLLIIILIIGAVASGVIGRFALGWFDRLIRGIPVIRDVYGSARQLTDAVFVSRSSLRKTVLTEYPSKGLYSLGFVTTDEPIFLPDGREAVWVYFPTTPNPTTGWLALVPKEAVTETGMAIEVGLKMVISGGLIRPAERPDLIVRPARLD